RHYALVPPGASHLRVLNTTDHEAPGPSTGSGRRSSPTAAHHAQLRRADIPANYGHWKTVYNRHRRWSGDGTWVLVLDELRRDADQAEGAQWTVGIDAGVVRAHQHA